MSDPSDDPWVKGLKCHSHSNMDTVKTVIRQSHTKSKGGCQACKRRHIKCDEFRPTCHKCLGSGNLCEYPPSGKGQEPGEFSPLWWPNAIDKSCEQWKQTGKPPFPTLTMATSPGWHTMPLADLRYLYQTALAVSMLDLSGTREMCLLLGEFRTMFQLAGRFECVAHMLVAASAERLAIRTKSHEASMDAYRYQALALRGLRRAIQCFSKSNADAILATALGCSYQCRTVITETLCQLVPQMRIWSNQYAFDHLFRCIPKEPWAKHHLGRSVPDEADYRNICAGELLGEGVSAINGLAICLRENKDLAAVARQLGDVMSLVQERRQTPIPTKEQFRLIYPFTAWFTKNSAASFIDVSKRDALVFLS